MALHDWLLLAGICALAAMTPGASLAVVTRHTLHGGHRGGLLAAASHTVGIALWAVATVTGMAALFHRHPELEQLLSLCGAAFLLFMAMQSWRAGKQPDANSADRAAVLHGAARDGFVVAFVNPKVALFFLALFSQFISSELSQAGRLQMVATSVLIDGGWYALVALVLGRSRLLPWLRARQQWVEKGTAVLLVIIAVSVLVNALTSGLPPG